MNVADGVQAFARGKRAIHDTVVAAIRPWGDFEILPKKGYVALRRKKQFAMIGPKNAAQAELGLNLKDDVASERIGVTDDEWALIGPLHCAVGLKRGSGCPGPRPFAGRLYHQAPCPL